MENAKEMCYNIGEKTSTQEKEWLEVILSLPLEEKRELLKVLRERRKYGLVYEKRNP